MSLFYLDREPHVSILAPSDGIVLPYDEFTVCEKIGLTMILHSSTVLSPITGTFTEKDPIRSEYILKDELGAKLILRLNIKSSCISEPITLGQRIDSGDPLLFLDPKKKNVIMSLTLENADNFRSITTFEGKCRANVTEIMSFTE